MIAFPDRAAVGADLLEVEVGVVDEPDGDAPSGKPVVGSREARRPGEGGAGDGPVRRRQPRQVPVRRQRRRQVRVVGQQRAPGRGSRRVDRPVVGAAAGDDLEEGGQLPGQVVGRLARLGPGR